MEADGVVEGLDEHARRVGVAQVLLDGERQVAEGVERADVGRVDAGEAFGPERVAAACEAADEVAEPVGLEGGLLGRVGDA